MTKEQRITAFSILGTWMNTMEEDTQYFVDSLYVKNPWYSRQNVTNQLIAIGNTLTQTQLEDWLAPYPAADNNKSVGLILAGNLPLVGFHDILSSLLMGFAVKIKTSSDDAGLTTFVLQKLIDIQPLFKDKIQIVDKLVDFDIVIATGSNNSARYFEYYFGKKPNIIRKNRNSVAVLNGYETIEDIHNLGKDIFDYFGLGCRSVSKVFIPKGYDIKYLFEPLEAYNNIIEHYKYNNNYDYNKSIYLINKDKHYDNGFLLLKEDQSLASPLAVLHYEEYTEINQVETALNQAKEDIQCVVSQGQLDIAIPQFSFGKSQCPALDDYADGVNTLEFLHANR